MRDLSRLAVNAMTVTSQEGGNMVHDNSPAMTAPGSEPATPVPAAESQSNPDLENSAHIPVGSRPDRHASNTSFSPPPLTWKVAGDG